MSYKKQHDLFDHRTRAFSVSPHYHKPSWWGLERVPSPTNPPPPPRQDRGSVRPRHSKLFKRAQNLLFLDGPSYYQFFTFLFYCMVVLLILCWTFIVLCIDFDVNCLGLPLQGWKGGVYIN